MSRRDQDTHSDVADAASDGETDRERHAPRGSLGMLSLPPEIFWIVMDLLDDRSFCAARRAHAAFAVHSDESISRARKMPMWLCTPGRVLCRHGKIDAVDFLLARGVRFGRNCLCAAIEGGHIEIASRIKRRNLSMSEVVDLLDVAVTHGHLDAVGFVLDLADDAISAACCENEFKAPEKEINSLGRAVSLAIDRATDDARPDIVARLLACRHCRCARRRACEAAARADIDALLFICRASDNAQHMVGADMVVWAAYEGHLAMLRRLWDHPRDDMIITTIAAEAAARRGQIETIEFLREKGFSVSLARAMRKAAAGCYVDPICSLYRAYSECRATVVIDIAAAHGNLCILEWLHRQAGQRCTTAAMDQAATNGHLSTVVWLHKHDSAGCTTAAMDGAARNGHRHVVEFLYMHRTEGCSAALLESAEPCPLAESLRIRYQVVGGKVVRSAGDPT
ncbi:ankyrin repeat domain containing protein [Pandoravirus japonicus]|uniref:Ankyrin repeat domain containing protein n=1 Tax=Pandoravirus japonicus TaxID=2823154 RepID=A0A811BP68_9VIRU|nr:ankyrin repeat domain containing protein [Pandoravirus japonicus]